MRTYFTIPHQLPGLNDIIDTARQSPFASARMKKEWMEIIVLEIRNRRVSGSIGRGCLKSPVSIHFNWFEPKDKPKQRRRDPDNVMAGQKFILDALVHERVIADDGPEDIIAIAHRFPLPIGDPQVEVELYEVHSP